MIGEFFIISREIKKNIAAVFTDGNDKVLDLGCGANPYYHKCIKGDIICFDKIKTRVSHVIGDADKLPFKANSFDKIISINSFYYFNNPFTVIKDLHKILKKDGKLILVLPFIYPIHDIPYDKYRFTEYGIIKILKKNFDLKEIKTIGGIFNLPSVVLHSLIKGVPLKAPSSVRKYIKFLLITTLYPFYIVAQLISLLDFLDKSGRWPTYYFAVAVKK